MKAYLVSFIAEVYCQGWEHSRILLLVYADSFEEACNKIRNIKDYRNLDYFENLTIL